MTTLIICADDFAQNAEIDQGILALIQQDIVTATSCLTLSPRWQLAAKNITPEIRSKADIGVHLDFTFYNQQFKKSLSQLILKSYARMIPKNQIVLSIRQQLDLFEHALNTAPDYIDGHQHIHQLPQIRDVLLDEMCKRYSTKVPWIRIAKPPFRDGVKAVVIRQLGANAMLEKTKRLGIRTTKVLLGVYNEQANATQYQYLLDNKLHFSVNDQECVALMCHPAIKSNNLSSQDPFFSDRGAEYLVLASNTFKNLLLVRNIQLVRGNVLN